MSIAATIDRLAVLRASSLAGTMSEERLKELAEVAEVQRCVKGEEIWSHGDRVDFFGLVASGFVRMVRSSASGVEMTMEIMGPGQTFGLLGVIEGSGCPLMAFGLTQTTYLKIPKKLLLTVFHESRQLSDLLLQRTSRRMHQKLDLMAKLSSGSAEQRLAATLLVLAESYAKPVNGSMQLAVPLTRQTLAEMAGLTTETTIRVLSKWTQDGLIHTDQSMISLLDIELLEERL